jgi:hypothetical protein
MDDGWVVREEPELELATARVKTYTREENGRPVQVKEYARGQQAVAGAQDTAKAGEALEHPADALHADAEPHPVKDAEAAADRGPSASTRTQWVPHPDWEQGEQSWVTRGETTWAARGKAAEAKAEDARKTADASRDAVGKQDGVVGAGTSWERPAHNYVAPDPSRLERERGKYKKPTDHPFFQRNPMTPENIVSAYDGSTPGEKQQGRRWYPDGARLAWALGGGDAELGAKVLSAYSPRTGWPLNMHNAARSLAEGRALGPGEGIIMGQHQKAAQAAIDGGDIDSVLPSPKTNAFARLLTTGGDHPGDELGQVVIDRHALSVAAGRRLTKGDTEGKGEFASPIGKDPFYSHVADQYRNAARQISDRDGEEISPSELQAITWLRQQRLNTADDLASEKKTSGLVTAMRNHWSAWEGWAKEHGVDTELGTTAQSPTPITADEARGNSRPVDADEFHAVASQGRDLLNGMAGNTQPMSGLMTKLDTIKAATWAQVQKPWGGATINPWTGEMLPDGVDKYALSVKAPGVKSISIPEDTSQQTFERILDEAIVKFRPQLEQSNHYLGVFHDDENGRIDIDPVVVVDNASQAEAIGAYTHNIGGSYHFATGNGHFPPHVADEPGLPAQK